MFITSQTFARCCRYDTNFPHFWKQIRYWDVMPQLYEQRNSGQSMRTAWAELVHVKGNENFVVYNRSVSGFIIMWNKMPNSWFCPNIVFYIFLCDVFSISEECYFVVNGHIFGGKLCQTKFLSIVIKWLKKYIFCFILF